MRVLRRPHKPIRRTPIKRLSVAFCRRGYGVLDPSSTFVTIQSMRISNIFALAAVAAFLFAGPAFARDHQSDHSYYRSSDGAAVHGPTRETSAAYGPVSADCRDGTHSYSHHHQGTCSGHSGVASWR